MSGDSTGESRLIQRPPPKLGIAARAVGGSEGGTPFGPVEPGPHDSLQRLLEDRERSVLVVHAEYFQSYLDELWHLTHGDNPWRT